MNIKDTETEITSPLPALTLLLPFVLRVFQESSPIPASLLSDAVLRRHHFLRPEVDDAAYLQANSQLGVREVLEDLSTKWLEDIRIEEPEYSATVDEVGRLLARIKVGVSGSEKVEIVLVWEEAEKGKAGDEALESAWRYYDVQAVTGGSRGNWKQSIPEALAVQHAKMQAREQERDQELEEQDEIDDFWDGVSDDEREDAKLDEEMSKHDDGEMEDDYWAGYDEQEEHIPQQQQRRDSKREIVMLQPDPHTPDAESLAERLEAVAIEREVESRRQSLYEGIKSNGISNQAVSNGGSDLDRDTQMALNGLWRMYRHQHEISQQQHDDIDQLRERFRHLAESVISAGD